MPRRCQPPRLRPNSPCLKDLECRDPIHTGRFHRRRRNPQLLEPFDQAMEVAGECRERTHRFRIHDLGHRHHMELRSDIDPGGPWMNHGPLSVLAFRSCNYSLSWYVMSWRGGRAHPCSDNGVIDQESGACSGPRPLIRLGLRSFNRSGGRPWPDTSVLVYERR